MKIIILAAGRGERLMPLTRNTPKPLLDLGNGNTLIEQQIASLYGAGVVDEIVLVIGYLGEQIEAKLKTYQRSGLIITTVFNPFYGVSNNLMSLWLARHRMDGDFIVTNGDNLFTPDVFEDLVRDTQDGIWLAINHKNQYDDDDMKVALEDGCVARVHKELDAERIAAESPGLSIVRGARARALYVDHLELLARAPESIDRFWLEVYNSLYERGVPVRPWEFDASTRWQEVDFHMDVRKLRQLIRRGVQESATAAIVDAVLEAEDDEHEADS